MSEGLELMRQMRKKKAEEEEFREWGDPYSKLEIKTGLRTTYRWLLLLVVTAIGFIMWGKVQNGVGWTVVAVPISVLGLCLAIFPNYEEWHYGPWQSRSQKCERHIVD